jgi:hypothetical protein
VNEAPLQYAAANPRQEGCGRGARQYQPGVRHRATEHQQVFPLAVSSQGPGSGRANVATATRTTTPTHRATTARITTITMALWPFLIDHQPSLLGLKPGTRPAVHSPGAPTTETIDPARKRRFECVREMPYRARGAHSRRRISALGRRS